MQKITAFWQRVRACVKVCVDWVWQNRLSAFLVMVGVALFVVLFGVMFNECAEYWVKRALGIGRKRDVIISLGIAGVAAIFGAVAVNKCVKVQVKRIRQKLDFLFPVAIGMALFVLFGVIFWPSFSDWVMGHFGGKEKQEVIEFIGFGIAGIVAIYGAVAINRRAEAEVRSAKAQGEAARAQSRAAEIQSKNNELVEKGHIQERFKTAVEHLESDKASTRISSFYEFSYLASNHGKLRENIFNILCAHLRQTTTDKEYQEKIGFTDEGENFRVKPTEEVQSLLDVLFQSKDNEGRWVFAKFKFNLQRSVLTGVDLRNADLQGANLDNANLQGAILFDVDLRRTRLASAKLHRAHLYDADLRHATLLLTVLQEANLSGAKLQHANLLWADLQGADLRRANLREADLEKADLDGVDLRDADLRGANLRNAKNLETADFKGAKVKSDMFPDRRDMPAGVIIVDEEDGS